jgi:pimeloyl-ACP methyl ester carboxylesterase
MYSPAEYNVSCVSDRVTVELLSVCRVCTCVGASVRQCAAWCEESQICHIRNLTTWRAPPLYTRDMASANTSSGSQLATFKFKSPVPTKPDPMTEFPITFLARLAEIEKKTHTVVLSSGRKMCYFEETHGGDPASLPVVLCIHGLGQSKELWMEPEPVPNVRLVAIDRIGSGASSLTPVPYGFSEAVAEIEEALDKIGVDKFYVVGHSAGGAMAVEVAAGLADKERVLGAAFISAMCDTYHATAPKVGSGDWKKLVGSTMFWRACSPEGGGWKGALVRNLLLKRMFGSMFYAARKDRDCGFLSMYRDNCRKADGGCERTWEAMDKDLFFVSKNLYSTLHGCNSTMTPLGDLWRTLGRWEIDCSRYKGPCVVYNGDNETTRREMAEQNHRAMPQSELVIMEGHGHTTIMLEAPSIIQALIAGKSAVQVY